MSTLLDTAAPVRQAPHHRNLTCYTDYACRRPECVERRRTWQLNNRRRQREGQPALVPAEPVRQHILSLREEGVSTYRIALLAGADDWTVRAFLPSSSGRRPVKHSTTPETARKILAVTAEAVTSGYMDGTGTRRRIQALVAAGWPMRNMAPHLGLYPTYIGDLTRREGRPVFTATAEKVARAYEKTKTKRPSRRGITPQAVKQAKERARANRWPAPKYWDQHPGAIDDPHFEPLYLVTRAEILAEDAHWLAAYGLGRGDIAARLGVDRSYVDKVLVGHEAVGAR